MDAILFYGEGSRSDASRRQVRSAAAQHSHRIGPRKPKSSKKPKAQPDASHQKKRSLKANTLSTSPSVPTSAAVGQAGKLAVAPAYPYPYNPHPPQASPTRSLFSGPLLPPPPVGVDVATLAAVSPLIDAPGFEDREKALKRRAAQARFLAIKAIQRQHEGQTEGADQEQQQQQQQHQHQHQQPLAHAPVHINSSSQELPPLQLPAPPPLVIERIEQPQPDTAPSSHSRNNSQASPQSPSTRLPQYSWTEYPRYGLGFNQLQSSLQMLAQVAVAERDASEARYPPASAPHDVPGFRQFSATAHHPPQPNPTTSSPQSGRLYGLPPPADHPPASNLPEAGPQLEVQPLTERPPLPASSTFGQFLQSAIEGNEQVDRVYRGPTSASSDEQLRDTESHFSPG